MTEMFQWPKCLSKKKQVKFDKIIWKKYIYLPYEIISHLWYAHQL